VRILDGEYPYVVNVLIEQGLIFERRRSHHRETPQAQSDRIVEIVTLGEGLEYSIGGGYVLRIGTRSFTRRQSGRGAGRAEAAARVQLAGLSRRCYRVCLRTGTEVELLYIPEEIQRCFGVPQEARTMFQDRRLVAPRRIRAPQRTESALAKTARWASGSGALRTDIRSSQGGQ
jgi:hypothetical protein